MSTPKLRSGVVVCISLVTIMLSLAAVPLALFVAVGFFMFVEPTPNRLVLVNSGSSPASDISVTLRLPDGSVGLSEHVPYLAPGETRVFEHWFNDSYGSCSFRLRGKRYQHDEGYIDLWTGEGWVFTLRDNGGVASGYEASLMRN